MVSRDSYKNSRLHTGTHVNVATYLLVVMLRLEAWPRPRGQKTWPRPRGVALGFDLVGLGLSLNEVRPQGQEASCPRIKCKFKKRNDWNTNIVKLKNYVFELNAFTSVPARFGSRKIFLLLNDSSHDSHFSTRQNMEPEEFLEKKSNFSLNGFSRYLTPNMALQKIILTSFLFFVFFFFFFPIEGYAFFMPYFLEDIEQSERNFADMLRGECSCP